MNRGKQGEKTRFSPNKRKKARQIHGDFKVYFWSHAREMVLSSIFVLSLILITGGRKTGWKKVPFPNKKERAARFS